MPRRFEFGDGDARTAGSLRFGSAGRAGSFGAASWVPSKSNHGGSLVVPWLWRESLLPKKGNGTTKWEGRMRWKVYEAEIICMQPAEAAGDA